MIIPPSTTNKQDTENDESTYKVITDEPVKDASSFIKQSDRLSNIIANSIPQFTIGVFGGWGTGKTTMMKMIKNQIENIQIISWKDIKNQDSEKNKLKKFIKDTYNPTLDWIDNAKFQVLDDNKKLILENPGNDDNKGEYSSKKPNKFTLVINEKKQAILESDDGKIREKLRIKEENKNDVLIYLFDQPILTIWFDAWKYENEEFSALVPFVRTIILHLEEYVTKSDQNVQKIAIKNLIKNFKKMSSAIIRNSKINIGLEQQFGEKAPFPKASFSLETDMNKVLHDYKSEGSFIRGQHEIRFYKHISERIEDELKKIRKSDEKRGKKIGARKIRDAELEETRKFKIVINFYKHISDRIEKYLKKSRKVMEKEEANIGENIELEETRKFKLVIFIDDLDRCTPDRALEILESIKTFFDIEGIICVIGMDPATIDPIIRSKYGENSKINALDYLQKIVQLPVQIPLWSDNDLTEALKEMTIKTGLPNDVTEKLLKNEQIKNLIIKSAKLNPRNIKRFINSLVLSYNMEDQNLKNIHDQHLRDYIIENYLKSMISIQTFYFRGDKWLRFVKMIMDYYDRVQFLTHFITFIALKNITSYQELEDKIKDIPTLEYPRHNKKILEIYNKIIEINDEDLFIFLTQAAEPLLRIDKIENYLRAVDAKKDIDTKKNIREIKSYESINKLQHGIQYFNGSLFIDYSIIIHLPYLSYLEFGLDKGNKFEGVVLQNSLLYRANLYGANLSRANLSAANLSAANLSTADLFGAILWKANLSSADLSFAYLVDANLSNANLSFTNLSFTNLSKANLSFADLSNANLKDVDLSDANLSSANLSSANLSSANLSEADLSFADLSEADLSNADLSNSIIINLRNYESFKLNEKTNFKDAITNDSNIIYHISRFTENIPEIINNKKELKNKLEERKLDQGYIKTLLKFSKLPD